MDMSKYIGIFRSESEKNIQEMSDSLLALEQNPENAEQMNILFRSAHTFKGMAATMGFKQIVELTHEMESLIDRSRTGKLTLDSYLIDILFECLDTLERLVEEVCAGMENKIVGREGDRSEGSNSGPDAEKILETLRTINNPSEEYILQKNEFCTFSLDKGIEEKGKRQEVKEKTGEKTEEKAGEKEKGEKEEETEGREKNEKERQSGKEVKTQSPKIHSSRVSTEKLDKLMNLVGELVINRSRVKELTGKLKSKDLDFALSDYQKLTRELQEEVLEIRMIPLDHITNIFPRMIRDLARGQNKKIDFIIRGKEIKIDRAIIEEIGDPLVHLLRNAVDHGIETPEKRVELGKEETGKIIITASRQQNYVLIRIEDDGKGIDAEEIRKIAFQRRLISRDEAEQLSERELIQLIFTPGLSTASEVTDLSGRGVGMDIVKNRIEHLGGSIKVDSKPGTGSRFELRLPITIALCQSMLVKVGMERYAIPFTNIIKSISVRKKDVRHIRSEEVILINEKTLPLLRLRKLFQLPAIENEENLDIVIVEKAGQYIGLVVDSLLGKQEIIIKTFKSRLLEKTRGFAGATVMGDGSVILILDINSIT
ncbi:chemotaxis protein [Methanosarcina mazei]|uniref:Chemotaxis protein CheA n=1 Tax=Methanosarcina mazei TaxID=2209 RepID=A0A0F8U7Y8_METMZ|nr:chemotaxis protein CheA [Methanosarcina mazei]KKH87381.1 chemotaxis protein [Methanosarcina mazei]